MNKPYFLAMYLQIAVIILLIAADSNSLVQYTLHVGEAETHDFYLRWAPYASNILMGIIIAKVVIIYLTLSNKLEFGLKTLLHYIWGWTCLITIGLFIYILVEQNQFLERLCEDRTIWYHTTEYTSGSTYFLLALLGEFISSHMINHAKEK